MQSQTGQPARVFKQFHYRTTTGSCSRTRRMVAKAEQIEGKEDPRYVVTNLSLRRRRSQALYEELYCGRGEMENRIKEQLSLFATRVSAETMSANQLRLSFAGCAYVLMHALRRLGLKGTELERAQATTIRLKLLKIGAQIRITVRKVWLWMATSYPRQTLLGQAWAHLRCQRKRASWSQETGKAIEGDRRRSIGRKSFRAPEHQRQLDICNWCTTSRPGKWPWKSRWNSSKNCQIGDFRRVCERWRLVPILFT